MRTKLIMLDTPIIVSDNTLLEENDFFVGYPNYNKIFQWNMGTGIHEGKSVYAKKIIAGIEGLPRIDWNGLEEEFGWVDVEKLAEEQYPYQKTPVSNYAQDLNSDKKIGFIKGFKKAQSLNDKKFSLEDMKKAVFKVYKNGIRSPKEGKQSFNEILNEIIQSLQQPKVLDIEVEMECAYGDECPSKGDYLKQHLCKIQPKITNNSIKIIKKL